jgi:hypothetical protein
MNNMLEPVYTGRSMLILLQGNQYYMSSFAPEVAVYFPVSDDFFMVNTLDGHDDVKFVFGDFELTVINKVQKRSRNPAIFSMFGERLECQAKIKETFFTVAECRRERLERTSMQYEDKLSMECNLKWRVDKLTEQLDLISLLYSDDPEMAVQSNTEGPDIVSHLHPFDKARYGHYVQLRDSYLLTGNKPTWTFNPRAHRFSIVGCFSDGATCDICKVGEETRKHATVNLSKYSEHLERYHPLLHNLVRVNEFEQKVIQGNTAVYNVPIEFTSERGLMAVELPYTFF